VVGPDGLDNEFFLGCRQGETAKYRELCSSRFWENNGPKGLGGTHGARPFTQLKSVE
jgi:hypothetical protein